MRKIFIVILAFGLCLAGASCAPKEKVPLVVFGAGSLIKPFDDLEKAFEAANPDIDVQSEYHGSIQVMRHATELKEKIDVVATADRSLIPMLMYDVNDPETGKPYAAWYLSFATNHLGLAYSDRSSYASEITPQNWTEVLLRPGVTVGIADPRFDASGYRAMMVYRLAEEAYQKPGLFDEMFEGQFRIPLTLIREDGAAVVHIPEVLETKKGAHVVLRGASIQLIALIESGDLDYAFEYESVIRQHNLRLVELPDTLNLGVAAENERYGKVMVRLDFRRFASVKPEFKGEQIGYGITIPSNAPHPQEAARYIAFLLGPEGRKIMEQNYHPLFDPVLADGFENLPPELKNLVQVKP